MVAVSGGAGVSLVVVVRLGVVDVVSTMVVVVEVVVTITQLTLGHGMVSGA